MKLILIIVPCFNEEEALPHFWKDLSLELESIAKTENLKTISVFVDLSITLIFAEIGFS